MGKLVVQLGISFSMLRAEMGEESFESFKESEQAALAISHKQLIEEY